MTKTVRIQFASLQMDGDTQSRVVIDQRTVEEYQEAIRSGDKFPPLDVFHDGEKWWLADGFHRVAALKAEGKKAHEVIIHQGGQRAAILWAVGANGKHGLRRSNEDKRKAVMTLLNDEEWSKWTNREIARRADVDEGMVRKYRNDSVAEVPQQRMGADGKTYDASKHAVTGKTTDQPSTPEPAQPPSFLSSLNPNKWYPVNPLTKKILFDPFDSYDAVKTDERYKLVHQPAQGMQIQHYPEYGDFRIIPGLPKVSDPKPRNQTFATLLSDDKYYPLDAEKRVVWNEPFDTVEALRLDSRYCPDKYRNSWAGPWLKGHDLIWSGNHSGYSLLPPLPKAEQPADPAPARTYPTSVIGNMQDNKYYPAIMKLANVHDEAFDTRLDCMNSARYPGNRPILGVSLNHQAFYKTFRLVAPAPSGLAAPTAIELPAPAGATETVALPTRFQFDPERFYPVDDANKHIYHDARLAAETIHAPYRAVNGSDLNHAPAFESYRLLDADLPAPTPAGQKSDLPETVQPAEPPSRATSKCQRCGEEVETTIKDFKANMWLCQECFDAAHPGWPTRPTPTPAPEEQPVKPNHPSIQDDKFYITDKRGSKIFTQPYDTFDEARRHIDSPFDQRVEKGSNLNSLFQYERWTPVAPANGNGNGSGATKPSGTPFIGKSNGGEYKDTPRNAHEAIAVANGQAAQKIMWQNALDFRILIETNLVEVDEETLKRCARPLKALVIEALNLSAGKIDRAGFGTAVGTFVTAVSEKPVKAAEPTR